MLMVNDGCLLSGESLTITMKQWYETGDDFMMDNDNQQKGDFMMKLGKLQTNVGMDCQQQ